MESTAPYLTNNGPGNNGVTAPLTVAVLSDDANKIALLQQLLAISKQSRFDLQFISNSCFAADQLCKHHLILLDRNFANRPFSDTVLDLAAVAGEQTLPSIIVLLDEEFLADDIANMATSVKTGVDDFVLTSELSLKKLLQIIQPPVANANRTITNEPIANRPMTSESRDLKSTPSQTVTAQTAELLAQTATHTTRSDAKNTIPVVDPAISSTNQAEPQTAMSAPLSSPSQLHQLTIDMENRRVHLSQDDSFILTDDSDAILSIDQWLLLLDKQGAEEFSHMLSRASDFLSVPKTIVCTVKSKTGITYPADISEIQIKENGKGRVVGVSAQILIGDTVVSPPIDSTASNTGFDNLGDMSHVAMVDKVWMNIAESLPIMCLVLDENGYVVRVLNGDRSSSHSFPEAYIGQTLSDLLGIESLDNYVDSIHKTLNTGKSHQQTIAYSGAGGTRWFDTFITKLRSDLGISRQVVWTAVDITTGRQAYQELLKNHDTLTDTLNDAPVLFCQKDADGRYQRVNRAFCETFNVRAEVIAGRSDQDIFEGDTLKQIAQQDNELVDQGGGVRFLQSETINGQTLNIQWHKFALKGHSGNKIESIAAFGFILTHEHIAQVESVQNADAINGSVENSAAIFNQPNIEDQDLFSAAVSMTAPSGAIGQDFKAIIKNIVSYTEIAISQKSTGREHRVIEYLSQLVSTSERARDLVIESSAQDIEDNQTEEVELKPLVRDIVQMLRPTLPGTLNFQTDLESAYGKALVSPVRFQRIVMQLLISARDSASSNAPPNTKNGCADKNEILLALKNKQYDARGCDACDEKLDGGYISLSVTTASGNLDAADLQKMVGAAAKVTQPESNGNNSSDGKKKNNNIVAMAHDNAGHVIIDYQQNTVTLELLFQHVSDHTGPDDDARAAKPQSTAEVTSLSSL